MAKAAPVTSIFQEVDGVLDLSKLVSTPQLRSKLRSLKQKLDVKIIRSQSGFTLRGGISSLVEFENAITDNRNTEIKRDFFICSEKYENLDHVYSFMDKKPWGRVSESITSSSNITFNKAKLCFFLLDKQEQILEVLEDSDAQMRLKEFTHDGVRIKLEKSKKSNQLEDEIKTFYQKCTTGMASFDIRIDKLKAPHQFLDQIRMRVKPVILFLKLVNNDQCTYTVSTLVLRSKVENACMEVKRIAQEFCDTSHDVPTLLLALCDRDVGDLNIGTSIQTQTDFVENRDNSKNSGNDNEQDSSPSVPEEKELMIGDQDVITYLSEFQRLHIHKIEKQFGIEVGWERKEEGVLLIRAKPSQLDIGDLEITRLAQGVFQLRTQLIDISTLDKVQFEQNKAEAGKQAKQRAFSIRMEGESKLFVMGPGEHLDECIKAVKVALGMPTGRRRFLAKTMSSPTPLPEHQDLNGATRPRDTKRSGELLPKAYIPTDGKINILAWKADITKLHVDVVVNAANENLDHGAGVAYAISKAAGRELDKQSNKYIRSYGKLKTADVCLTTAGYMPSKKVMHTVGPVWYNYKNKSECEILLFQAFFNCLDRANTNKYTSIALPAISSGIYGAPKEVVASLAMKAVLTFCQNYPFPWVTYIHLVDILPDTVKCFQNELNDLVKKRIVRENTQHVEFKRWLLERPQHSSSKTDHQTTRSFRERSVGPVVQEPSHYDKSHNNNWTESISLPYHIGQHVADKERHAMPPNGENYNRNQEEAMDVDSTNTMDEDSIDTDDNKSTADGAKQNSLELKSELHKSSYSDAVKQTPKPRDDDMAEVHGVRRKAENKTGDKSKETTEEIDTCSICMDIPTNPFTLPDCKHTFCKACIDTCFKKMQPKCPNCGVLYGKLHGNQPNNGYMNVTRVGKQLPGYDRCGTIIIHYNFPDGLQAENHPYPGYRYHGTRRTAYLPDNNEGNEVLRLLRDAFAAKMIFTVGQSSTTGQDNCVIWNCIHHKTSMNPGPYGYPDATYLSRVTAELAAAGFK